MRIEGSIRTSRMWRGVSAQSALWHLRQTVFHLLQTVPPQLQQLQQLSAIQQQQLQQLQQTLQVIPAQLQQLIPFASHAQQQPSPFQSPFGQAGLGAFGGTSPFGIGPQIFGAQSGHVM